MANFVSTISGNPDTYQGTNPFDPSYGQNAENEQQATQGVQQTLGQALLSQMNGQGPNPAGTQLEMGQQANIANAQGMIASQRGLNPALAARMGVNQAASANNQTNLQAALLRQQQQLQAQAQLQGLTGQEQQGNLGQQQLYEQGSLGAQGITAASQLENAKSQTSLIGGAISGGASAGAAAIGAAHGARVPGVPDGRTDSLANDKVPAMLSPGEIVVPNSKAHDPEKAKAFIDHLLGHKEKKETSYGDVLAARRKKAA